MRCPSLAELPPPPRGRTGWPWTHESRRLPERMPDGRPWPTITIVTPSYRQAGYLEETIRSVLLQGYPELEYIVIDGGSDDGSVEIVEKYAPWMTYWTSEPDDGQSDAINKGFRRSSGVVMAWLNSDDSYYPGALQRVARILAREEAPILIGAMSKVEVIDGKVRIVARSSPTEGTPMHPLAIYSRGGGPKRLHFMQPPMFWMRQVWESAGELDTRYHFTMDLEWCSRAIARGAMVATTESILARFRLHPAAKTQDLLPRALRERALMYLRLSRMAGFRRVACVLASLYPFRRSLILEAVRLTGEGRRAAAIGLRGCARVIRLVQLGLGWRAWSRRLLPRSAAPGERVR